MWKRYAIISCIALAGSLLPTQDASADDPNPVVRAHQRGAKQSAERRRRRAQTRNRPALQAPELSVATGAAPLALLVATGLLLRAHRRANPEDAA